MADYGGQFEMVGNIKNGDEIRQTHKRFRKITDCESYINATDQDYESEDAIFSGCFYKTDTPQIKLGKKCQYGNGCNFKHEIIEYRGNNCFLPTKGYCFIKCNNFITDQDYNI